MFRISNWSLVFESQLVNGQAGQLINGANVRKRRQSERSDHYCSAQLASIFFYRKLERWPPVLLASIKPPSSSFHRKYSREVAMVASSAGGQFSCPSGQGKGPKRAINTNTVETWFLYKYQYNTTKGTAIQVKSEIEIHCKYNGKIVEIQYKGRGESWLVKVSSSRVRPPTSAIHRLVYIFGARFLSCHTSALILL